MKRMRYNDLIVRKMKTARSIYGDDDYRPILAIWLLEMALYFHWYRKPERDELPEIVKDDSHYALLVDLQVEPTSADDAFEDEDDFELRESRAIRKLSNAVLADKLRTKLAAWKKKPLSGQMTLVQNIELLGRALSLDRADLAVLSFALFLKAIPVFERIICEQTQEVSTRQLATLIGLLTGHPAEAITKALGTDSRLVTSGLVTLDRENQYVENKLDVMSNLVSAMIMPHESEQDLVAHFLQPASPATLDLDAFPHLATDIATILSYLSNAAKAGTPGINILFYGPPGTGKTELAKALSQALGRELYEIKYADHDGNPIAGSRRLRSFVFCQKLLERQSKALVMFDEIEDVFPSMGGLLALFGMDEDGEEKSPHKAWINRTMERNPVPAIWITNNPRIDTAYLRRFDYSVNFPVPPIDVRVEIARHHLGTVAPNEEWLNRIAANEHVSPSQYERMAKLARLAGGESEPGYLVAERTLERSMRLLRQKHLPVRNTIHTAYDISFINVDQDIGRLIAGLKRHPKGSLCFYGPPGTGKSELARHMADQIHHPVIVRRASDILDMYVGGTEAKIAGMFMEARERDAVLVLDEADGFLTDRRGATRSWEVTPVNELLTQMEAFDGIFVCTTNLMDNLDPASLRRFAFKIRFDYLKPGQRWQMFALQFARLGGKLEDARGLESSVQKLERLTPGDFAVAVRKLAVWGEVPSAVELYEMLKTECALKGGGKAIGFMA